MLKTTQVRNEFEHRRCESRRPHTRHRSGTISARTGDFRRCPPQASQRAVTPWQTVRHSVHCFLMTEIIVPIPSAHSNRTGVEFC